MPTRQEPIVKTALLGTERRPLTAVDLAAIGQAPAGDDPARTALEALAAIHLRSKAGFLLCDAPADQPDPAPYDKRTVCSPLAVQVLRQMLAGQHGLALREFADLLTQTNQRVPPEILPDILHKGLENRALFVHWEPLLGPVGQWLARQHLRWAALLPDPQADWFTGSFADRQRLLLEKRRRNPLMAMTWLAATWRQETSPHQFRFLEILLHGLSAMDESLLQLAATDKKDPVRLAALRLLDLVNLPNAEILRLATARQPDYFPAGVQREHWPKTARQALLSASIFSADLLAGVWPGLLQQLTSLDRAMPGWLEVEEVAVLIAYQGDLPALEAGYREYSGQLPSETGHLLSNLLSFRRRMVTALAPPESPG